MNLFVLDSIPELAAQAHADIHVNKMIVETAQLLSTAHRVLDGVETVKVNLETGRRTKTWIMEDYREDRLYKSAHYNHPSAKWVRASSQNYRWAAELLQCLLKEFEFRYGREHSTKALLPWLKYPPLNIQSGMMVVKFDVCINEDLYPGVKTSDPVESYRNYYLKKADKMKLIWTKREKPVWYTK